MKKIVVLAFFIFFNLHAQIVKKIDFNQPSLLPLVPINKGEKISPSLIKQTIVNLYKTGLFYNVIVKTEEEKDGVIVKIEAIPAKYFGEIKTKGKIGIKKRRLKKFYSEFYPLGKVFRQEELENFVQKLKEKIKELGYPDVKIDYKITEKDNIVYPEIHIESGKPLIVASIKTNNKKLYKKFIKIKEKDIYNKELFLHGIKKLKFYLRKNHYLNSNIAFKEHIVNHNVYLEVNIDKGTKFEIKSKNLNIETDRIEGTCAFLKSGKINDSTIKLTEKNLYFQALKEGYCNPQIKVEINKKYLFCEIENPTKKKIEKIKIESDIPLKLTKKILNFNKLTKSDIYSELSEQLVKKGYLKPSIKFDYNEIDKTLIVKVYQGKRYKIGKITWNSDIPIPEKLKSMLIKENEIFVKEKIFNTLSILKSYLNGEGYFDPQVNIKIEKPSNEKIPVNIIINAGEKIFLKDIVILGSQKIKREHILKFASFKQGALICKSCMEDFKNRLEFTGLFNKVELNLVKQKDNQAVLLVKVKENRLYSFSYAIGINSDEGLRFTAKIKKRYLFNTFLTGTTIFRISSKRRQGYFTISGEKHFLSSVYFTLEDKDDYKFSRFGFSLSYRGDIFSRLRFVESIEFTKNNLTNVRVPFEEIEKELQPDYTIGFRSNLLYDRRNDILFPTKGYFIRANLFPAYSLTDDEFFFKANIKTGFYFKNLEFITNIGKIFTKNGYQVPIPQRFFTGGSTNLRISSFEKAGPQFSTGVSKGGHFLFVFSGEYKYHIKNIYYLSIFADIGNVWEDSSDFSFSSCIKDAGIGLTVKTPVGPIKIQLAHNLDKDTFPSNYKIVFSLGTTF
ncbi:BamA/OMP85 family outer membrane protein [Thermotomaculum hydrothermale]|nr:POTRA domain-containing protein [Thermotomaculum hydrothermale]